MGIVRFAGRKADLQRVERGRDEGLDPACGEAGGESRERGRRGDCLLRGVRGGFM